MELMQEYQQDTERNNELDREQVSFKEGGFKRTIVCEFIEQ